MTDAERETADLVSEADACRARILQIELELEIRDEQERTYFPTVKDTQQR